MRVQTSAAPPGVLVAAADENLRFLLRLTLRQAGFDPLVAADGREAVALFVRHRDEIQVVLRFAMLVHCLLAGAEGAGRGPGRLEGPRPVLARLMRWPRRCFCRCPVHFGCLTATQDPSPCRPRRRVVNSIP